MKKKFRPNVYVKVFKLTNSYGCLTECDFNNFKKSFEEKQNLYFDENINDYCFESFREMTKEIKRVANNAGLKAELLKLDFESYKDYIKIKGPNVRDINFIVSLSKVYKSDTRNVSFIITKIEAFSNFNINNSAYKIIDIDNNMMDCDSITYVYQEYKNKPNYTFDNHREDEINNDKHIYRCIDNINYL